MPYNLLSIAQTSDKGCICHSYLTLEHGADEKLFVPGEQKLPKVLDEHRTVSRTQNGFQPMHTFTPASKQL